MPLPATRTRRAVVHSAAASSAAAVIVAVFAVAGWVSELILVGVIGIVVTVGAAYVLSRP